jgi:hypothetical protein
MLQTTDFVPTAYDAVVVVIPAPVWLLGLPLLRGVMNPPEPPALEASLGFAALPPPASALPLPMKPIIHAAAPAGGIV